MWQKIKNLYHLIQAYLAAIYFQFPSNNLTIIAVTGTDGKTTTVNMIFDVLQSLGAKPAMVSSVNAKILNQGIETGLHVSTPDSWTLQKLLKKAKDAGCKYFVLEATSHGLDQNRLAFIKVETAVLTNITSEHLDYHKTWENYALSKLGLFKNATNKILNQDDQESFIFFKNKLSSYKTYSLNKTADYNQKNTKISLNIPGQYNLHNALAAYATLQVHGFSKEKILKALNGFKLPKGRMEEIDVGQNFKVLVDFAHTPNALKNALETLKAQKVKNAKMIAVFGSAGERDRQKRPKMGEVAGQLADIVILTAEDPRGEQAEDIARDIAKGLVKSGKEENKNYFVIPDRHLAIKKAIQLAAAGDIIGFFGKGHEKSMCFGKIESPWDEFAEIEKELKTINEK